VIPGIRKESSFLCVEECVKEFSGCGKRAQEEEEEGVVSVKSSAKRR
jgi:hypothetical protein